MDSHFWQFRWTMSIGGSIYFKFYIYTLNKYTDGYLFLKFSIMPFAFITGFLEFFRTTCHNHIFVVAYISNVFSAVNQSIILTPVHYTFITNTNVIPIICVIKYLLVVCNIVMFNIFFRVGTPN